MTEQDRIKRKVEAERVAIYKAIAKIQAAGAVRRDGHNPHFGSKFASLPQLVRHLNTHLAEDEIIMQRVPVHHPETHWPGVKIVLTRTNSLVSVESAPFYAPAAKEQVQNYAAVNTYLARYSILNFFNLEVEDNDAEAERRAHEMEEMKRTPLTDEEKARLISLLVESGQFSPEEAEAAVAEVSQATKAKAFQKAQALVLEAKKAAESDEEGTA